MIYWESNVRKRWVWSAQYSKKMEQPLEKKTKRIFLYFPPTNLTLIFARTKFIFDLNVHPNGLVMQLTVKKFTFRLYSVLLMSFECFLLLPLFHSSMPYIFVNENYLKWRLFVCSSYNYNYEAHALQIAVILNKCVPQTYLQHKAYLQ